MMFIKNSINQGELVLIPFPFTDLKSHKLRPALVISKENNEEDLVILAITSKKSNSTKKIDNQDLERGKLPLVSFVKYKKVACLHKKLIKQKVGKLNASKTKDIVIKFCKQF